MGKNQLGSNINAFDCNKVFIVHGHDDGSVAKVALFIYELGLTPVILDEQPEHGRTIIEKFEEYSSVGFAIVLYTPCDKGSAKDEAQLNNRARQNVVFEHGFFAAKLGRERVCLLVKDSVELPSDLNGILYIPMKDGWEYKIIKELKAAGYNVSAGSISDTNKPTAGNNEGSLYASSLGTAQTEASADVIAIGALNYDFMFIDDYEPFSNESDSGEEVFIENHNRVMNMIDTSLSERNQSPGFEIQLGGSAFLALKTAHSAHAAIRAEFIGVLGATPFQAKRSVFPNDELAFLEERSPLLFTSSELAGCAHILMHERPRKRKRIHINPGANNLLWDKICEKGDDALLTRLVNARWIHLSSLADFLQFKKIFDLVRKAKERNNKLMISFDPGYSYILHNSVKLDESVFPHVDYVFMSEKEATEYAHGSKNYSSEIFNFPRSRTIGVIKQETGSDIFIGDFGSGREIKHINRAVPIVCEAEIKNDTGAGDAFAGGFIAGMLIWEHESIVQRLEKADNLGKTASRARLLTYKNPFPKIKLDCESYIRNNS